MTLTGIVQDARNDAGKWLRLFARVYESWLGQPIYPGSLNVDIGRPFDWHAPELLPHRRRFSLLPHGGERDLFMVPARIVHPGEQPCWLWTTTTAADHRDDLNTVEVIAAVRLRSSLGLVTGAPVEIICPEPWHTN